MSVHNLYTIRFFTGSQCRSHINDVMLMWLLSAVIIKVLNKCRHLPNIICDENSRVNSQLAQLDIYIKIKKYNIDLESKVLASNNKSICYKFINK